MVPSVAHRREDGNVTFPSGTAGAPVAAMAVRPDLCTATDPGNDDRDHATPIAISTKVPGSLQTVSDVDYYEFSTPASPASGGVVSAAVTDVTSGAETQSAAWSSSGRRTP
jgi:hypothetical protein